MHATIRNFGYPQSLVKEWPHWVMLIRPAQITLGSVIIAARSNALNFGALEKPALQEFTDILAPIEKALRDFTDYEKINWLMLMMVDPHVHFHVIPRYEGTRIWERINMVDTGWPKAPDLAKAHKLEAPQMELMAQNIRTFL